MSLGWFEEGRGGVGGVSTGRVLCALDGEGMEVVGRGAEGRDGVGWE